MNVPRIIPITLLAALASSGAHVAWAQTVGPARGTLMAVGGNLRDPAIVRRFIDHAGGPDAPIVVIPTAGEDAVYDERWLGLRQFRDAGARQLTMLHTRDRTVADSEAFVRPLRHARGVFFTGGRQWRLADAYLGTRTSRELEALLARGGVIGGTSAGATILGSFLVRGDTTGPELMMGDHAVPSRLSPGPPLGPEPPDLGHARVAGAVPAGGRPASRTARHPFLKTMPGAGHVSGVRALVRPSRDLS